jgi:hypothetical protein
MRRSKSDPSKYARNYRKISQRQMTQYDAVDDDKEIERLRSVLRTSERHLELQVDEPPNTAGPGGNGKKRKRSGGERDETDTSAEGRHHDNRNAVATMLSDELLAEGAAVSGLASNTNAENPLIVLPNKNQKRKKKDETTTAAPLTREEIREAKALRKRTVRKLQQLETRTAQKRRRAELYKRLEESNQIAQAMTLQPLLASSGRLSRKESDTKKQTLKRILNKERAQLTLTEGERDLLYPKRTVQEPSPIPPTQSSETIRQIFDVGPGTERKGDVVGDGFVAGNHGEDRPIEKDRDAADEVDKQTMEGSNEDETRTRAVSASKAEASSSDGTASGLDFAAQMMASLSKLKVESSETKHGPVKNTLYDMATSVEPEERYVPTNPTVLKTAASMGLQPSSTSIPDRLKRTVVEIKRPPEVEKTRLDLPVTGMEFEIMDAIRNNDVTIICSETGSGKSTQIPAYLYENGMSSCPGIPEATFIIGVTQPRRVAAISTAKRVCYEMGQGDGQCIRGSNGKGNLVAYRTRFESAGSGKATRVQFMTDGILLTEIQSDLLLRRYSVIVLDESHERNLNTDVLIGLLSKTLPLRKKAAEEDPSIVPLKLILMSATLRVEDFTKNEMLFPTGPPAVVTVPGRTHPVTVHHSKTTELDDYGKKVITTHG